MILMSIKNYAKMWIKRLDLLIKTFKKIIKMTTEKKVQKLKAI